MPFQSKVVLHCPSGKPAGLDALVETFLKDGVKFVGVVGKDASLIEDIIDEILVGDGSDETRQILTSSHEDETIKEALEFVRTLTGEYAGEAQLVEV